jgi:site-specific DNA recombinase
MADSKVPIMGSKSDLLRTLAAASGAKSAAGDVRSSVPKWRATPDDDEHYVHAIAL